jgi:hypothetical protein
MTKCDNLTSIAKDAAVRTDTIPQILTLSSSSKTHILSGSTPNYKTKKRSKMNNDGSSANGGHKSYNLPFVPVDSIKHAPSIITASIEAASSVLAPTQINNNGDKDNFKLEFCVRERSLPYVKMIQGRMLVNAFDSNLQHVDSKAIFLLAEATIWILKDIIKKLAERSKFKHQIREESAFEIYKNCFINDERIIKKQEDRLKSNIKSDEKIDFHLHSDLYRIRQELNELKKDEASKNGEMFDINEDDFSKNKDDNEWNNNYHLKNTKIEINNPLIAPPKLSITLFDLKSLLQVIIQYFIIFYNLFYNYSLFDDLL